MGFMLRFQRQIDKKTEIKGFTLAELLLTIVIVGVIASVTLAPLLKEYKILTYKK